MHCFQTPKRPTGGESELKKKCREVAAEAETEGDADKKKTSEGGRKGKYERVVF